jgi:hypothetical protein
MNPLASIKCASRVLVALAAVSGVLFAVGCGSSSPAPVPPPSGGFSNSSLNGTYVFSTTGIDANGAFLAIAGALVANGNGGVTGGSMDVVDAGFTSLPSPVAQSITGSYSVGVDGRGRVNVKSSVGSFTFSFVLNSSSHGLISEFDGNGTGSGTIDLQTALTGISQLAAPYAFSVAGIDANSNPFASAGSFTLNSNGGITAGVQDFNDAGFAHTDQPLTGTTPITLGSGTGPGTITLNSTFGALAFDFYPIDATHLKLIETDFSQSILAGDAFTQTGASIPNGPMVFTMAGGTSGTGPIANGGLMTSNGTGNFSAGFEDVNEGGTVSQVPLQFSGASAAGGSVGGRVIVNLTGFAPATQWVIYPSSGGLLILETDSLNITLGAAYAQTATSFAAAQGYGLNLTGENPNGEVDYIAQFNATSPTSTPNMSGLLDDNEFAVPVGSLSLSGTYTPDSPATGRGFIVVPTIGTFNTTLGLQYYVVNSSTILFIDVDSQQVAVGSFALQSAPTSQVAAHPVVSLLRQASAPSHGAFRRK